MFCVFCMSVYLLCFCVYFCFPSVLCYCWLGLLTCKTVSQITLVLVETLNPAHSLTHQKLLLCKKLAQENLYRKKTCTRLTDHTCKFLNLVPDDLHKFLGQISWASVAGIRLANYWWSVWYWRDAACRRRPTWGVWHMTSSGSANEAGVWRLDARTPQNQPLP